MRRTALFSAILLAASPAFAQNHTSQRRSATPHANTVRDHRRNIVACEINGKVVTNGNKTTATGVRRACRNGQTSSARVGNATNSIVAGTINGGVVQNNR